MTHRTAFLDNNNAIFTVLVTIWQLLLSLGFTYSKHNPYNETKFYILIRFLAVFTFTILNINKGMAL